MVIEDLLEKPQNELTQDEAMFVLNFMVDALYNQSENQKATIRIMEETIQSHAHAITELQLAMTSLYEQFDIVKEASVQLGGGYHKDSQSGIILR